MSSSYQTQSAMPGVLRYEDKIPIKANANHFSGIQNKNDNFKSQKNINFASQTSLGSFNKLPDITVTRSRNL